MLYADASALVKLVRREAETDAVVRLLAGAPAACTSMVGWVEVVLSSRRGRGVEGARRARAVLRELTIIELDRLIAEEAARLTALRSLDAIHLASALAVRDELEGFVTYDRRLAQAATGSGLAVLAPS